MSTNAQWEKELAATAIAEGRDIPASWETQFDDGADGCMPRGWYLIGLDKNGLPITWPIRHEYGPFDSQLEALGRLLPAPARIAIYFGVDRLRGPRAAAATVLVRYAAEWRRDRRFNPGLDRAKKIAARFRLVDFYNALLALTTP